MAFDHDSVDVYEEAGDGWGDLRKELGFMTSSRFFSFAFFPCLRICSENS